MTGAQADADFLSRQPVPKGATRDRWEWAVRRALRYRSEGRKTMTVESILQDGRDGRKAFPRGANPDSFISLALNLLWLEDVRKRRSKPKM